MSAYPFPITPGKPEPLGISKQNNGVNFSLVSSQAQAVTLCLYSPEDCSKPLYEIVFNPQENRIGYVWHICLEQLPQHLLYRYCINNSSICVLDPYAKEVYTTHVWGTGGPKARPYTPFGVVDPAPLFDWEQDKAPQIALEDVILYEMHVRGYTQHPSSKVRYPGTFLGIVEKIPHLKELGVNAIELLPVHEFNECEYKQINPITKGPLCNYWGYSTVNYFSPMQRYATRTEQGLVITEFKTMVKELHRNGIEVILDVVFNHTAEGGEKGPVLSFKGIDLKTYYMVDSHGKYMDYTGCGNTFNCNFPVAATLILDSLRYWVTEMRVDGFRFDLASVLTRYTDGQPLELLSIVEQIAEDPILANTKLIAEPWDAVGLYQVGSFPHEHRWSEWNGRYRDVVRRFIKGTGRNGDFVTNLCGSEDMYYKESPCRSVNFITAHDGFSLADLVAFTHKHNQENGENNRDGFNNNESWNCGVEGPTTDKNILSLRQRQMRNFLLCLMISKGVPMILMGDEYAHTRKGNNNTWCQDNELNWFLWDSLQTNKDFYRYYRNLINFRQKHASLRENKFFTPEDITWHGMELLKPNWEGQFIAFSFDDLYFAFNAKNASVKVHMPTNQETTKWYWVVNTALPSPNDFIEEETSQPVKDLYYQMAPYSSIALILK